MHRCPISEFLQNVSQTHDASANMAAEFNDVTANMAAQCDDVRATMAAGKSDTMHRVVDPATPQSSEYCYQSIQGPLQRKQSG